MEKSLKRARSITNIIWILLLIGGVSVLFVHSWPEYLVSIIVFCALTFSGLLSIPGVIFSIKAIQAKGGGRAIYFLIVNLLFSLGLLFAIFVVIYTMLTR